MRKWCVARFKGGYNDRSSKKKMGFQIVQGDEETEKETRSNAKDANAVRQGNATVVMKSNNGSDA
jgi:exopolysaccharide biosynthesis protein